MREEGRHKLNIALFVIHFDSLATRCGAERGVQSA